MRTRSAVLTIAVVMTCTLSAFASGPQIGIGDPNCNSWNPALGTLQIVTTSNSFTLQSNSLGGGFFGICNQSGALWSTVDIRVLTTFTPADITCTSTVFNVCDKTELSGGNGIDLFFHITQTNSNGDSGGIPDNQLMTVNLDSNCTPTPTNNCNNNDGDWPANLTFYGGTNQNAVIPTPEPTTLALLGGGLLSLWQYRRRRK